MKYYIIFIIVMFCAIGFAQPRHRSADRNFESLWYKKAALQYEYIISKGDKSQEVLQKTGDAYFFNTDMKNASKWYGELFANYEKVLSPRYIFRYIHSLKGIGNYSLAKAIMKIHADKLEKDGFNVAQLYDNDDELDHILSKQPQFYVTNLSSNSKVADFGPTFYKDKIVFASNRDSLKLRTRIYKWNDQPWLDLFIADPILDGTDFKNIKPFSKNVNTKYHEATAAFENNGDRMYFTRNNFTDSEVKRDDSGLNHLKLYYADLVDGEWINITEVPFNGENYSVGQPALSPDDKQLYFVSDMPGSIGATDIYVVDVLEDNLFSKPRNLGNTINTSGKEMFPFVTDKKLYFSSDGHLGLGGLDIFESKLEKMVSSPINLGKPLNSNKDDFSYIVNESTRRGYFSSNRDGGVGDDDIYSFKRMKERCKEFVEGMVLNKIDGLPLVNVKVSLENNIGVLLEETNTDSFGNFKFTEFLSCKTSYNLKVLKTGFLQKEKIFTTTSMLDNSNNIMVSLEKSLNNLIVNENGVLKIKIDNIYFDLNKATIRQDAAKELNKVVQLMKEYPKMKIKIESHTDARGSDLYNEELSDMRAKSTAKYIISQGIAANRINSAIGYGEKQLINKCMDGIKCSNVEHNLNRRSEFIIVELNTP